MTIEVIRTLYGYNNWANQAVLDSAARLSQEQLHSKMGASFDTIHATLVHIVGSQWIWLSRWQGSSPDRVFDPADFDGLEAVRQRWQEIEQDTQVFVQALDEPALARVVNYTNTRGTGFSYPLWQLMVHQVNHATQHRSEIAMILTQMGHSPGWLDLIKYLAEV